MNRTGKTNCPQKVADGREPGHGAKSGAVRERAVVALLSASTLQAAAEQCGLSERTLRRWMADDADFQRELTEARRAAFQAGMHRVQAMTGTAIETLAALMAPEVSAAVRLGAARTVAELGIYQQDAEMIRRKIDELEAFQRRQEGT